MHPYKHVGILNAYDARNRGDRAIVEAQLGWIQQNLPNTTVTVFSPHHQYNRAIFESVTSMDPLFSAPRLSSTLGKLIHPLVDWVLYQIGARSDERAKSFETCDAFFVCGGGYLYSSPAPLLSRQLWLHAACILAALRSGKPVLSFPQSWGPIRKTTDRWICQRLAKALPVIVTRGKQSDELLRTWGFGEKILSLPDIVIAASSLIPEVKKWREVPCENGSLGIAPINWNFERKVAEDGLAEYIAKIVKICMTWCEKPGRSITVFPQVEVEGTDDDGIIARQLMSALNKAGIPATLADGLDWNNYWSRIASQEVFIGCRMHSCIFAMVCGVPTIGLGYQPKFAELFEQLGWPDRTHLIDKFLPETVANQLQELVCNDERKKITVTIDDAGSSLLAALDRAWQKSVSHQK